MLETTIYDLLKQNSLFVKRGRYNSPVQSQLQTIFMFGYWLIKTGWYMVRCGAYLNSGSRELEQQKTEKNWMELVPVLHKPNYIIMLTDKILNRLSIKNR